MNTQFNKWTSTLGAGKNTYVISVADEPLESSIALVNQMRHDAEANAKLIAAAPELLETLRQLLTTDYNDPDMLLRAQSDAKRAVNKALGR